MSLHLCTGEGFANGELPRIAPEADTVSAIKFACGKGVLPNAEHFRLYDHGHEDPGPVEFTVRGTGNCLGSSFPDGTIPRCAVFTEVPFGQVEISETVPPGYGERRGGVGAHDTFKASSGRTRLPMRNSLVDHGRQPVCIVLGIERNRACAGYPATRNR